MSNNPVLNTLDKVFSRLETKLVFLLSYTACLVYSSFRNGVWGAIEAHIAIVTIIAFFQFGKEFVRVVFFPLYAIIIPIFHGLAMRYVKRFKNNVPAEVVIILGHSDWLTLEAWVKPNFFDFELKALVTYLTKKGQDFSFYTRASVDDVKTIMRDPNVKEIYFFGHGDSHVFQLGTNEFLYYCDFKCEGYQKDYVHQVHCGTKDGTPLMEYVVPKEHWNKCFFFPREINGDRIVKEFKKRTSELKQNQR